jgi:hypothetical protein
VSILHATVRARGTPLSVSPASANGLFTNSPASNLPATRTISSGSVTASGGTGAYSWARISGPTRVTANNPSSATTNFVSTNIPVATVDVAVFRVTSGAETVDVTVTIEYNNGF